MTIRWNRVKETILTNGHHIEIGLKFKKILQKMLIFASVSVAKGLRNNVVCTYENDMHLQLHCTISLNVIYT